MNRTWPIILLISLLLLTGSATAGQLKVTVLSYKPTTQPEIRIRAPDLNLVGNEDGTWNFEFVNHSAFQSLVTIDADAPDGYRSYPLTFYVPYYSDGSEQVDVAGAIVNQTTSLPTILDFIEESRTTPSEVGDLAVLNQRARRIWRDVRDNAPDQESVIVAYQLLLTTRKLAEKFNLQVDGDSRSAANWLSQIADSEDASRLLKRATVRSNQVKAMIDFVDQRDATHFKALVQETSKRIGSFIPELASQGCDRAKELRFFLERLPSSKAAHYDPDGLRSFESLIDVSICKARALNDVASAAGTPSQADLDEAEELHQQLTNAVAKFEEKGVGPQLRAQAAREGMNLNQIIAHLRPGETS